jgi:endonuclease YncB( thermonuclease family)
MGEQTEPQPGWITVGEIVAVKDGDTVKVRITREIDVRLLGCWADESRRDPRIKSDIDREAAKLRGIAAKEHLRRVALGKQCVLMIPTQTDGEDNTTTDVGDVFSLSRALGRVWVDGKDLSELQVERGYATREKGGG